MTWDQVSGLLRQILPLIGGYCVGRGWITEEQMTLIIGGVIAVGSAVWSLKANNARSITLAADKIDPVMKAEIRRQG